MRAYRIAYDGHPYHGFQRQPDVDTVEDRLISALAALGVTDGDVPPGYAAAGRTDAGVSALAQTVAFEAPGWLTPQALNSELPESIQAWATADVPADFHATHHAESREYTYFLHADGASERRTRAALDGLAGEHDFHNLTPDDTGTTRTLHTALDRDGSFFVLRFRAGGFPRQFVRRAVALVAELARGERALRALDRVLGADPLAGPEGIGPARPDPLVMTAVSYSDITFTTDEEATQRVQQQFRTLHRQRAAGARVAGVLGQAGDDSD
ncbi:tRNA pseudouridine38-40 synthase [Halovenus aranensis]|uniref:tRNA pseudouridine synthase A n=1 Tax=Halovenus aranensis TaxID=890420 RepID=A0A1G8X811_9EURY|nr:tRNA pseudouridine(38-40) synthase TruA [Halovenus aranensis]SDJ85985.1 tRNA pseudouridine38-40 synthase [Halovenus aranensis]